MNRIKKLRLERGETLEKLAKYLNVTIQTISNYENEKRDITPEVIIKLAEYFNVSTDYLLGKTDKKNNTNDVETEIMWALSGGYEALNDTNREIAKSVIESLLAKQEQEEKGEKTNG